MVIERYGAWREITSMGCVMRISVVRFMTSMIQCLVGLIHANTKVRYVGLLPDMLHYQVFHVRRSSILHTRNPDNEHKLTIHQVEPEYGTLTTHHRMMCRRCTAFKLDHLHDIHERFTKILGLGSWHVSSDWER